MTRRRAAALLAGLLCASLAAPASAATSSPRVVEGRTGWLYVSQDWSVPCQDAGQAATTGQALGRLAQALRLRGRSVAVVLGPDKSTVVDAPLPPVIPKRACGQAEKAALWSATLRGTSDALDLRTALRTLQRTDAAYWRKDTHWTPTGGVVYARALAEHFAPSVAAGLTTRRTTWSRDGDLARVLQRPEAETVAGLQLVNPGVRSSELSRADVGLLLSARRTRAVAGPGARVVPGRTVFLGDSFTDVAVEQLAPLFEEAVYVVVHKGEPIEPVIKQLRRADRVVVQRVERLAQRGRMTEPDALAAVRRLPPRVPLASAAVDDVTDRPPGSVPR